MNAVTPNAKNHGHLPPLASRFVDVAALPWEKTRFAGVEAKTLVVDRETGVGALGGLMLAIFQIPNKFYEAGGRETDVGGEDWNAVWAKALFR